MTDPVPTPITLLGLGAMGQAMTTAFRNAGHATTVWNRSPGRADALVAQGATKATSLHSAVTASPLVIVCLLDHASVHQTLDPVTDSLSGQVLVNLTSTTPNESRELARWATDHGATYLDGGIMAIPEMIGQPGSLLLYSGDQAAFDRHRSELAVLGEATYLGSDPGTAATHDFALLAAMYAMFGGFLHAAAMVRADGVLAQQFAPMAVGWLQAMAETLPGLAEEVDRGDHRTDVQSLDFNRSALDSIVRATQDAEIDPILVRPLQQLVHQQIEAGHGTAAFSRVIESIRLRVDGQP